MLDDPTICGLSLTDYFIRTEEFHGARSPGMLIGGLMVDRALATLGPTPYLNVVTETVVCLPDAVQLLTPCTMGNGFLKVFDWGKFALTAYDRGTLKGARVWLDFAAMNRFPAVSLWFDRVRPPEDKPSFEDLAEEMVAGRGELVRARGVHLHRALKGTERVPTGICPGCGESYALRNGPLCPACRGEGYYDD